MNYHSFRLLQPQEISVIVRQLMMSPDWVDGTSSAKGHAKQIKKNLQLSNASDVYKDLSKQISDMLMHNISVMDRYVFPKNIINMLFSRTSKGMYYGSHVDAAHTPNGRRDYSFTLFLNDPSEYDGGELIVNIPPERKSIKLESGMIFIYPTKYLHEVKEVTRGERIVCVGWIESYIKKDSERELLSYIKTAMICNQAGESNKTVLSLNLAFQGLKKYFGD